MKPYINFNNEKRTECSKNKDKFGVDQCKLYNNSLFGKQIEVMKNTKIKKLQIMKKNLKNLHLK